MMFKPINRVFARRIGAMTLHEVRDPAIAGRVDRGDAREQDGRGWRVAVDCRNTILNGEDAVPKQAATESNSTASHRVHS